MNKILGFLIITITILGCDPSAISSSKKEQQKQELSSDSSINAELDQPEIDIIPASLLTTEDAAKILGEPVHLTDSSTTFKDGVLRYQCTYTADAQEPKTGKLGNLYFLYEHYAEVSSAIKKYGFIKTSNEDHGIKDMSGVGDEAYFHTDKENFYFIMAREEEKVFNMKVSKITAKTSLDEFQKVAKNIAKMIK